VRTTRDGRTCLLPYLVLLRVGFSVPRPVTRRAVRSYRTFSPLPVPEGHRRCVFCGTFRGLTPPRRYLAPCPAEPGLSSTLARSGCLADSRLHDSGCIESPFVRFPAKFGPVNANLLPDTNWTDYSANA
jgi:hypothetical protein